MHGAQDATLSDSWANTAEGTATRKGSYPIHEGKGPACAAPSRLGCTCSSPPQISAHVTPSKKYPTYAILLHAVHPRIPTLLKKAYMLMRQPTCGRTVRRREAQWQRTALLSLK